jgi:hypothetical protein
LITKLHRKRLGVADYKTICQFPVKRAGIPVIEEAAVYSPNIFTGDFALEEKDLIEVIKLLCRNERPTSGLDSKGRRAKYQSEEENAGDLYEIVMNYMKAYGECFRDPAPTFFDKTRRLLCPISKDSA